MQQPQLASGVRPRRRRAVKNSEFRAVHASNDAPAVMARPWSHIVQTICDWPSLLERARQIGGELGSVDVPDTAPVRPHASCISRLTTTPARSTWPRHGRRRVDGGTAKLSTQATTRAAAAHGRGARVRGQELDDRGPRPRHAGTPRYPDGPQQRAGRRLAQRQVGTLVAPATTHSRFQDETACLSRG